MKSISNTQNQIYQQEQQSENMLKKLIEIQAINKEKQAYLSKIQKEISTLESAALILDQQVTHHQKEWKDIQARLQQEKPAEEEQAEMNEWIQNVQKMKGLSQNAINSLCSMQFEGGQQQICLSCYAELAVGVMCTYLPCCHLFHQQCIGNHLKVNKTCPACQQVVEG